MRLQHEFLPFNTAPNRNTNCYSCHPVCLQFTGSILLQQRLEFGSPLQVPYAGEMWGKEVGEFAEGSGLIATPRTARTPVYAGYGSNIKKLFDHLTSGCPILAQNDYIMRPTEMVHIYIIPHAKH